MGKGDRLWMGKGKGDHFFESAIAFLGEVECDRFYGDECDF